MKFLNKALPILVSAVLLGSTLGFAAADLGSYPAPFIADGAADVAIVYGADAAVTDMEAAGIFSSDLATELASQTAGTSTTTATKGVSEDEVDLGGAVNIDDLSENLTDSDISTLLDSSISWDDGSGSDDYDVHEEIVLNSGADLKILTSLNDEEFVTPVMTVGQNDIIYKYVFDDAIDLTMIGNESADDLILSVLGQEMEITAINLTNQYITVNLATEKVMKVDSTATVDSKVVTVKSIYENSVSVDVAGTEKIVSLDNTRTINGIKVEVTDIGYDSNTPTLSTAVLKIGEDISKTYEDDDAYIGEDEDNPTWRWYIQNVSAGKPIIGVTYSDDAEKVTAEDDPITIGESYSLPNDFAQIKLVGLTSVTNKEYSITFDSKNLYNSSTEDNPGKALSNVDVLIIEGPDKESIEVGTVQTSKIAIWMNQTVIDANNASSSARVYAYDDDEDNQFEYVRTILAVGGDIGYLVNDETKLNISMVFNNVTTATLKINDDADFAGNEDIVLNVTGTAAFSALGVAEEANAADVKINGTSFGTEENSIMQHYGIIVNTVEGNAENDKVIIEVPDEQVYANVAVLAKGGSVSGGSSSISALGDVLMTDSEAIAAPNSNMIVIGGSAINKVAAKMLGLTYPAYGAEFTAVAKAGADEAIVMIANNPYTDTKKAMLVAGWAAKDTTAAAKYVINNADSLKGKTEQVLTTATGVAVIKA